VQEQQLHLPDLLFAKFFEEKYGINRGVYNTIDAWFYENGINNISKRRKIIIDFFEFSGCSTIQGEETKRHKFGHGGLRNKLDKYVDERINKRRIGGVS
jgi:riboflavin kinase